MTVETKKDFLSLRKTIIENTFQHLNEKQRQAVLATEGPLLLLAGAGSGKTTVLISRIANLMLYGRASDTEEIPEDLRETDLAFLRLYRDNLDDQALREAGAAKARAICALAPVRPWEILAITFTNKAADELKHRLEKRLGDEARDIWAMTFHSACVRILRRYIDRLGYDNGFTIYDSADSQSLVKRILADFNLDDKTYQPRQILADIGRAKDAQQDPAAYQALAEKEGDHYRRRTAEVYVEYAKRLRKADAVDFDDLLFLTVKLLQTDEEVRRHYQRQFRYVLIDEYQDTNNLQYLFANLLAGGYGNICVVGDDDQSIYKFRGATIQNILNFEQQHPGARTIRLEQNYRSTGHILEAANAVIKNNQGRKGKHLWTDQGSGEKLTHYAARSQEEEANYVAQCILTSFGQGGNWSDHAVLYRMSALSNQLEFAFKRNGIPYKVVGGMRFFDYAEIKDVLAYLAVLVNPADDLRLLRIINTPARGIGATTIERVREASLASGLSVYETLQTAEEIPDLGRSATKLTAFRALLKDLSEKVNSMPLDEFYDYLLTATGYLAMLKEKPDENLARIEHIQELKSTIAGYIERSEGKDLGGFLDEIALYTDLDSGEQSENGTVLMTMHSAKGLEFDHVYLVGLEEGIFPGHRSIGDRDEMEEERRLCYVALTRAKQKLHLVSTAQRMLFGRTTANMPSRFLEEIPEDYLERAGETRRATRDNRIDIQFEDEAPWSNRPTSVASIPGRPSPSKPCYTPPVKTTLPTFQKGDTVRHKAFGEGIITNLTPMGGDALVEIAFESTGTKRLMLKAAAQHMEKV
ncbi:MAG: UvrD-helicase domain-containing protein [Oscillospiraceae bacterium]|nr:UvrD-helicase domain-containing protein [Oscillospiraceae bacterium]